LRTDGRFYYDIVKIFTKRFPSGANVRKSIPLILAAALAFPACQRAKTPEARGKAYYLGYGCQACHRIGGEGSNVGPDLTFVGYRKSAEWLDLWMKDPHDWKPDTNMPNFKIPEEARKAITAYLSSLKGDAYLEGRRPWDAPALMDDPVKRGESIYNKAGCNSCHGAAGAGGYPNNNVVGGKIPALKLVADGYSKEELKQKIREGVRHPDKADPSGPDPFLYMPAWGEKLKDDELDALVEYLYSLRPASAVRDWSE
jgi:mono/diheme cytochrome c family protein